VKFVRAAFRYGVDENSAKVALTDIKRRKKDLVFLYGVERD
jgi:hypothetical protein